MTKRREIPTYDDCIRAAGAEILASAEFGSYQGDAWFLVQHKGKTGWVRLSYGSCSGCDAILAEFDFGRHANDTDEEWNAATAAVVFADLKNLLSQEEAEKKANKHASWDSGSKGAVAFVREQGPLFGLQVGA